MKKLLITAYVIIQVIIHTYATDVIADQSIYVLGGPSYGAFYTDDNYLNGIIGYEKDFTDRWSIAGEIQKSYRIYPENGNMYSVTPILRYEFFDINSIRAYGLGGLGFTWHDLGSIHDGDIYGHRSSGEYLYNIVAGVGVNKTFDWLSLISEIRYRHGSNLSNKDNYGCDEFEGFIGIGINL